MQARAIKTKFISVYYNKVDFVTEPATLLLNKGFVPYVRRARRRYTMFFSKPVSLMIGSVSEKVRAMYIVLSVASFCVRNLCIY